MYPNGAQFCLSLTFDIEMSYNFPYWTSDYPDYGAIDPHVKQYVHTMLDVAKKYDVKFQFFIVGSALEDPDADYLKRLVAEGHALDNHTYRHSNVKAQRVENLHSSYREAPWRAGGLTPIECLRHEIRQTTIGLRRRLGVETSGFRTPGAFPNGLEDVPAVQALLQEEGFRFASAHYRCPAERTWHPPRGDMEAAVRHSLDALQPYRYPSGLSEIPMMGLSDAIAFRSLDLDRWEYIHHTTVAVDHAHEHGQIYSLLAHPSYLAARDPHCDMLDTVLRRALDKPGGCWVATNREVNETLLVA